MEVSSSSVDLDSQTKRHESGLSEKPLPLIDVSQENIQVQKPIQIKAKARAMPVLPVFAQASPESELPKNCKLHPTEKVRYFCRDDRQAICPECVVMHARHDFVLANQDAADMLSGDLAYLITEVLMNK